MVCIPCEELGGVEGRLAKSFEAADVFDYWELGDDGSARHTARNTARHGSSCVEAIERRRTDAVLVVSIASHTLARFSSLGVKVFRAEGPSVQEALRSLAAGTLKRMDVKKGSS
jgi:predicted Fe-Mo cluster-binding NifX family protein